MKIIVYIVFALFMSIAYLIFVTLRKKKDDFQDEVTTKSYVAPASFFAAGAIGFVANALHILGAPIWWFIIVLIIIGSFFIKYLPKPKE